MNFFLLTITPCELNVGMTLTEVQLTRLAIAFKFVFMAGCRVHTEKIAYLLMIFLDKVFNGIS